MLSGTETEQVSCNENKSCFNQTREEEELSETETEQESYNENKSCDKDTSS